MLLVRGSHLMCLKNISDARESFPMLWQLGRIGFYSTSYLSKRPKSQSWLVKVWMSWNEVSWNWFWMAVLELLTSDKDPKGLRPEDFHIWKYRVNKIVLV